eukprot:Gb_06916 [translate_table: standard]
MSIKEGLPGCAGLGAGCVLGSGRCACVRCGEPVVHPVRSEAHSHSHPGWVCLRVAYLAKRVRVPGQVKATSAISKANAGNIDLEAILTFDGASKNNPRLTRASGCLLIPGKGTVHLFACGLGRLTNNATEYAVAIRGLKFLRDMGIKSLLLQGDSILVLNQISRTWVKVAWHLEDLFDEAQDLIRAFDHVTFKHTPCTNNLIADYLANIGMALSAEQPQEVGLIPLQNCVETRRNMFAGLGRNVS